MDQRRPQLGSRTEPVCDYLRRPVAGRLSEPGVNVPKPGYGNGGKANCAFPPFPQPLLLTRFFRPTVYTKYLTLPGTENTFTSIENTFTSTENTFASTENTFASTENTFASTENTFASTENTFASTENTFASTENTFASTENTLISIENTNFRN